MGSQGESTTSKEDFGIKLRDWILEQCPLTKGPMTQEQVDKFLQMLQIICSAQPEQPSGQSQLQQSPIDLFHWYEVQNLFHSYFTSQFVNMEEEGPLVLKALRTMLIEVQKVEFFALYDCLFEWIWAIYQQENSGTAKSNKWHNLFELFEIMDIVESKLQDKTHSKLVFETPMLESDRAKILAKNMSEMFTEFLENYWASSLMVVFEMGIESQMRQLREIESDIDSRIKKLKEKFNLKYPEEISEFFLAQSSSIQVALMTKFYQDGNKKTRLEEAIQPKQIFITNLIILQSEKPSYPLKVALGVLQVMHCFIQLDLVRDLGYRRESENPFFLEAVRHCQTYALLVQRIAHAQLSIKPPKETDQKAIDVDMNSTHAWHNSESNETSQRYLSYFVRFVDLIVRTRTNVVQSQLYPQLVEPLIAICTVKPKDGYYLMNIGCQKNALKVVKEITKVLPFDNTRQLNLIVERLHAEIQILLQCDLKGTVPTFKVHPNDDTQRYSYSLARRQSFISNVLRFLCFAIIRMDPSALEGQQHSKKIFESELFTETLRRDVFQANRCKNEVSEIFTKMIDPIFLPTVQLYTYVLNDLPQKLVECVNSHLIQDILDSMERRIPLQPDFMLIVMKFLSTMHLNAESQEALRKSRVVEKLFSEAKDNCITKLIGTDMIYQHREVMNSLVSVDREIAERVCRVILDNLNELVVRAWEVTANFIEMEKTTEKMTDAEKAPHKEAYGREQLALEQCLETSIALLDFYFTLELEYVELNSETCIGHTLVKMQAELQKTLYSVLKTPIIASAADNYIYHFQETATSLQMVLNNFEEHLTELWKMVTTQLNNLRALLVGGGKLNVGSFDDLDQLLSLPQNCPTSSEVILAEDGTQEQRDLTYKLKGDDQILVTVSKLYIYFQMIMSAETLSRGSDRTEKQNIFMIVLGEQFKKNDELGESVLSALFKVQSFLKRGYSSLRTAKDMLEVSIWESNITQSTIEEKNDLLGAFEFISASRSGLDFPKTLLSKELIEDTNNEITTMFGRETFDLDKLSQQNTISTMRDRAYSDIKTIGGRITAPAKEGVIDWQLYPETDSVNATVKFYKRQRGFFVFLQHAFNRKRLLFREPCPEHHFVFNVWYAQMLTREIDLIIQRTADASSLQIATILFIASEVNFTLPALAKVLLAAKNLASGYFLTELLAQEKGNIMAKIFKVLEWALIQMYLYETNSTACKMVSVVHSLQEIQKNCVEVVRAFVTGKFIFGNNHVNVLHAFRGTAPHTKLSVLTGEQSVPLSAVSIRNFLYETIFQPSVEFLVKTYDEGGLPPIVQIADMINPYIAKELMSLAELACQGFRKGVSLHLHGKEQATPQTKAPASPKKPSPVRRNASLNQPDSDLLRDKYRLQLMDMGFAEEEVMSALELKNGDFTAALDFLIVKRDKNEEVEEPKGKQDEKSKAPDEEEVVVPEAEIRAEINRMAAQIDTGPFSWILLALQKHFIPMVTKSLTYTTIEDRESLVLHLLSTIKNEDKNENTSKIASTLIEQLFKQALESPVPDWLLVHLTANVITYHRSTALVVTTSVYGHLNMIGDLFLGQITKMEEQVKSTSQSSNDSDLSDAAFNIKQHLELLYLVFEDIRTTKDLDHIREMLKGNESESPAPAADGPKKILDELIQSKKETDMKQLSGQFEKMETLAEKTVPIYTNTEETAKFLTTSMTLLCRLIKALGACSYARVYTQNRKITFIVTKVVQLFKSLAKLDTIGTNNQFSFRQTFAQSDCIRLLFDIKVIDEEWKSPKDQIQSAGDLSINQDLVELLVLIRGAPLAYQKYYETLIKNTMLMQFRENFKRGEPDKPFMETFFALRAPELHQQQQDASPTRVKKKKSQTLKEQTRAKSQVKLPAQIFSPKNGVTFFQKIAPGEEREELQPVENKKVKKLIKTYEMYNEADFKEFLTNFTKPPMATNNHNHVDNLSEFLAACCKVCTLKHVLVKEDKKVEEKADGEEEQKVQEKEDQYKLVTKILLKKPILREMLADQEGYITSLLPAQHTGNFSMKQNEFLAALGSKKGKINQTAHKNLTNSKHQTELLNQLLDILMKQTKGHKMDILKHFRDPTGKNLKGGVQHSLKIVDDESVILDPHQIADPAVVIDSAFEEPVTKMVPRNIYFFGATSIIQVINMLLMTQQKLIGVVLRHNDAKTIKFIFRNLFFLAALEVEGPSREVHIKDLDSRIETPTKNQLIIFMTQLLLESVHSSRPSKKLKRELQQIFIEQLSTNLLLNYPKSEDAAPWARQSQLLLKYGQVWLLQKFLAHQEKTPNLSNLGSDEKVIAAVFQKTQRLWTIQRNMLTKHLVLQCQRNGQAGEHEFILMNQIQELMTGLQPRPESLFFIRANQRNHAILLCVKAIATIMKPLEAVFAAQKAKALQLEESKEHSGFSADEGVEDEMEDMDEEEKSASGNSYVEGSFQHEDQDEEDNESEEDSYGSDSYGADQFYELSSAGNSSDGRGELPSSNEIGEAEDADGWDQPLSDMPSDFEDAEGHYNMQDDFNEQLLPMVQSQEMADLIEAKMSREASDFDDDNPSPIQLRPVRQTGEEDSSYMEMSGDNGSQLSESYDEQEANSNFEESDPLSYDQEERSMLSDRPMENDHDLLSDGYQSYEEYDQEGEVVGDQNELFMQFQRATHLHHHNFHQHVGGNQTHIVLQMDQRQNPLDNMMQLPPLDGADVGGRGLPQQFQLNMEINYVHPNQMVPFRNELEQQLQQNCRLPGHMIPQIANHITRVFSQKLNPLIKGAQEEYLSHFQIQQFLKTAKMTEGLYYAHMQSMQEMQIEGEEEIKQMVMDQLETNAAQTNMGQISTVQMESSSNAQSRQEAKPEAPSRPKGDDPFQIEGMDPLFMESLDPMGLQNIADSRRVQHNITNQSAQAAINPTTGQNMFTNLQDISSFIRSQSNVRRQELLRQFREGMIGDLAPDLQVDSQRQQLLEMALDQGRSSLPEQSPLPRHRELSVDSESLIVGGTNDHSQLVPMVRTNEQDAPTRQSQREKISQEQQILKKRQVRGSTFVMNQFQSIQDAIKITENDPMGKHITKLCESTIKEALIADPESDSLEVQFSKVRAPVSIAVCGFRSLSTTEREELEPSIRLLHRIPNLRLALTLQVLKLSRIEFQKFKAHIQSGVKAPFERCSFHFGDAEATPASILMAFKTINDMQHGLRLLNGRKTDLFEIIKPLTSDNQLAKFAELVGDIDVDISILEGIVDLVLVFIKDVMENKWIVHRDPKKEKIELNDFFDLIIESVFEIVKPITSDLKKQKAISLSQDLVYKLCDLMLLDQVKLSKKSVQFVRRTLSGLVSSNEESARVVHNFLDAKVNHLLSHKIESLTERVSQSDGRVFATSNQIRAETEKIQELLKISASLHTRGEEECICDEALLTKVFSIASNIVKEEERRVAQILAEPTSPTSPSSQAAEPKKTDRLVIFKPEIQELMLLIFSLCEYNLKFIEAKASEEQKEQQQEERMIDTRDLTVLEMPEVIDNKFINIILNNYSCTEKVKGRLRTQVSFFICNKSLINHFIRVNQHFASNVVLKNLIVKIPQILDFDTKRLIWRLDLKRRQAKYKETGVDIRVNRNNVFGDSYEQLAALEPNQWKKKFAVEFDNEEGIDAGGLIKEWFILLSKWIFNEDNALFIKSAQGSTYYPNPNSTVQPDYIRLFNFVGKIFGKALWDQQLLECYFVKAFYKIMLGRQLTHEDILDYDEQLFKSQKWFLENSNVQDISQYFVETVDYFGKQTEVELIEDGANTLVNDENKFDYVKKVANYRLYEQSKAQIDSFMKGFQSIVPIDLLKIFDQRELELLISGLPTIDIDDLREHTIYEGGFTARSKPVQFLFTVLREFDDSERSEFLKFVTGSTKVPVEGFKGLRGSQGLQKFKIVCVKRAGNRLPQSHTCFNQLDLPEYRDKQTLKDKLLLAIREGKTFGIA